jgi:Flp pilus assembly protein TadG
VTTGLSQASIAYSEPILGRLSKIRSHRGRSRAQALAEFAISLPIILLVVGITVDFGRAYYFDLAIRDASFAAARYAGMNPSDDTGIKNAAVNAAPSGVLTTGAVTISTPVVTGCTGSRKSGCPLKIAVSYVFSPITPIITALTGTGITLNRNQTDIIK